MTTETPPPTQYVLTEQSVRWGIEVLTVRKIHPWFLAYLHVREQSTLEAVAPRSGWSALVPLLEVPGGPPGKPFYRPMWLSAGSPNHYWLNENLAGSFAPSSVRAGQAPLRVVDIVGGRRKQFKLKEHHADLALQHLLAAEPLDAIALSLFLYRNYAFTGPIDGPTVAGLLDVFCRDFTFQPTSQEDDFHTLFHLDSLESEAEWAFEPWTPGGDEESHV